MKIMNEYYFDQIRFQRLNRTTFELTDLYVINFPLRMRVITGKIRFTEDSKYLFVNMKQDHENYQSVGVVDVETAKLTYFDFDGKNL